MIDLPGVERLPLYLHPALDTNSFIGGPPPPLGILLPRASVPLKRL